ncbi:MAG: tetratricopeptide repeat protein, partial [Bacteroidetes bacterium]|nr:tetratricopeptide repeat protein [Bacteroidota bacterium]
PFIYHVTNFSIHIIASLLVWLLARNFFLLYTQKALDTRLQIAALFAALVFATHPVCTQAVSYISQRLASLSAMLYLSSIFFYIKCRLVGRLNLKTFILYIFTSMSIVLCFFSKETSLTIPFMICLLEFYLIAPYMTKKNPESESNQILKYIILFAVCALLIIFFLLFVYNGFLEALLRPRKSESHIGDVFTLGTYILTQFRVMMHFIRLLVVPFWQNVSYDFPMSHSFFEWVTFLSFLAYSAALAIAIKIRKYSMLLSFGLLWFFLTLSTNFVPRNHIIFEHKLYLASVGPCIALAYFLFTKFKSFIKYIVCMTIIVTTFSYLAFQRNKLWQNEIALWSDIVKKSPKKPLAWANLGSLYTVERKFDKAMVALNKALELQNDHLSAYNNRGFIYMETGELDKALADFNRAIAIDPNISVPYTNKAKILKRRGDYESALKILTKAISLNPNDYEAWNVRGAIYGKFGKYDKAFDDFQQANKANPHYSHPYSNMSLIRKYQNRLDESMVYINKAISMEPNNGTFYFNRAMLFLLKNDLSKALADANRSLKLSPNLTKAYNQRGVIYAKLQDYDKAIADFNKAISINDQYAEAHNNLGMAYQLINNSSAALNHLNKAIQLDPNYAAAYRNRARLYKKQG